MLSASVHRPYRAPELLFGARSYDARASDLWSLGATFAEFFTTLRLHDTSDSDYEPDGADADAECDPTRPFAVVEGRSDSARMEWERCALFDASRGDIGLAWSIFKTRGSPSAHNWPVSSCRVSPGPRPSPAAQPTVRRSWTSPTRPK